LRKRFREKAALTETGKWKKIRKRKGRKEGREGARGRDEGTCSNVSKAIDSVM